MTSMTSIGFGGGEVIEVELPLDEVRRLLEDARGQRLFVDFEDLGGETIIINPGQVKVLQETRPRVGD
jgi:hypothetical protein